jgi:GlpG protein
MGDVGYAMRLIGHLKTEANAKTLADYLLSLDIRNLVERDAEGWGIWIYSEDQIAAGREALGGFERNPGDRKYLEASARAAALQEQQRDAQRKYEQRVRTSGQIWMDARVGPVTLTLIVLSILVTLLGAVDATAPVLNVLQISRYLHGLPEVRQGQLWRLITPIFIHFSLLHIAFNMLMLRSLGTMIEFRQGFRTLLGLVVVIGIGSNLGQYYYGGPLFGGMSGVLYGLLGYIWMRGQCDPASRLVLDPMTLAMMLVWFVLCLVGIIPGVANACHACGLGLGLLLGALPLVKTIF